MAFKCTDTLTNLIADFDLFINGANNADVTLSDNHIMPSYQKFCIEQLTRTGNVWSAIKTYLINDIITYNNKIFISLTNNLNKQPDLYLTDFREIKQESTKAGFGISGYLSYYMQDMNIVASKEVLSVTQISEDEHEITLSDNIRVGAGNKIIFGFSYSSEDIDLNYIAKFPYPNTSYLYFVAARTTINNDNTIRFKFNKSKINWNPRFDFIFLEV